MTGASSAAGRLARTASVVFRLLEDVGSEAAAAIEGEAAADGGLGETSVVPRWDAPRTRTRGLSSRRACELRMGTSRFLPDPFHLGPLRGQRYARGRKISFAITSRWICEVPS